MKKKTGKTKEWKNVLSIALDNRKDILKLLADEKTRGRMQFFVIFVVFAVISLGMTIMNHLTGWHLLGVGTMLFGISNIVNVILCFICERTEHMARVLFSIEFILVFTYFTIIGEPEGFSVIWVALFPACGLLLYGLKSGTLLSVVQLVILCALFWTPAGTGILMYDYTESFCQRFPLLYVAFFFVGFIFESVIVLAQRELTEMKNSFEYQSIHDPLTGILNRGGFNRTIDEFLLEYKGQDFSFAISDLDKFKDVNDTYGHQNGDIVLKYVAEKLSEMVGRDGTVCRWGGEEFAIFFRSGVDAEALCEKIREEIKKKVFNFDGHECNIAISTGLVLIPATYSGKISTVVTVADTNLYYAKEHGRDQICVSSME